MEKSGSRFEAQSEMPFSAFSGYIKKITLGDLDEMKRTALDHAFPNFWHIETPSDETKLLIAEPDRIGADEVALQAQPNRRFSGGDDLPRGRYSSLSKDAAGQDGGTLVDELTAYMSPRIYSQFIVFDLAFDIAVDFLRSAFGIHTRKQKALTLLFAERPDDPNPFINLFRTRFREHDFAKLESGSSYLPVFIPYSVLETHIDNCIDLRTLDAQAWMVRKFCLERSGVFLKFDTPNPRFADLLFWLLSPRIGGDAFTEGVGQYLRRHGANALIYPSARSEICAIQEHGKLIDWSGWNIVDYRGASDISHKRTIDLTGAEPLVLSSELTFRIVEKGDLFGSWQLNGLRKMHKKHINPDRYR